MAESGRKSSVEAWTDDTRRWIPEPQLRISPFQTMAGARNDIVRASRVLVQGGPRC